MLGLEADMSARWGVTQGYDILPRHFRPDLPLLLWSRVPGVTDSQLTMIALLSG